MNRSINIAAGSLALWGVWLVSSMLGRGVEFDGLSFMFAAVCTTQLILLAGKNRDSDAFKTLLVLQAIVNLVCIGAIAFAVDVKLVRTILMYATLGQLAIGYTVAFRRRKLVR